MNFTSWAENIYQKLEKICIDNDAIQVPCKCVDAVGDHFMKVLGDVASDWLSTPSGSVDMVVPPSENNVVSNDYKKSMIRFEENALDNMLAAVEVESIITSAEDLREEIPKSPITYTTGENHNNTEPVASSLEDPILDKAVDLGQENTFDGYNIKTTTLECTGTTCSGQAYKNVETVALSAEDRGLVMLDVSQESSQQNTCDENIERSIPTECTPITSSSRIGKTCKDTDTITSMEDPTISMSLDVDEGLSQTDFYNELEIKSVSIETTDTSLSEGTRIYKNISESLESPADNTSSLPLANEVCTSEFHLNESMGETLLPGYASSVETHDTSVSLDMASSVAFIGGEECQQTESDKLGVTGTSDGCNGGALLKGLVLVPSKSELFGDVSLEDRWNPTEVELLTISNKACYKKKSKRAFILKLLSLKHRKGVGNWHQGLRTEKLNAQMLGASSVITGSACPEPEKSLTDDSCESDWVLL